MMPHLSPEIVADALKGSLCRLMLPGHHDRLPIGPDQNLLELVDSFGFAELILDIEAVLDVQLPLDEVDLASIVHVEHLIDFVCRQGERVCR